MNFSQFYDDVNAAKVPEYERSVDKPIYAQAFQPVAFDKKTFVEEEIPIYYQNEEEIKVTVGSFLQMLFLQLIPVVGLVLLFTWALSKDNNYVRRTFSRAMLIFYAVAGVVGGLAYWMAINMH